MLIYSSLKHIWNMNSKIEFKMGLFRWKSPQIVAMNDLWDCFFVISDHMKNIHRPPDDPSDE